MVFGRMLNSVEKLGRDLISDCARVFGEGTETLMQLFNNQFQIFFFLNKDFVGSKTQGSSIVLNESLRLDLIIGSHIGYRVGSSMFCLT